MSNSQGSPLCSEEKKHIVLLKEYFDRNRAEFGFKDRSAQMVADALNLGLSTVDRVMASYRKNPASLDAVPQPKGRPEYALESTSQEIVRSLVRKANLDGKRMTLEILKDTIQAQFPEHSFHISTLARTLDRWGFEHGKGTRTQHLKEKDYIVAHRHRYLRRMRANRLANGETIRPEVYLDESYVNKNHSNDFVWYACEDGPWIQKPTGNGERFVIVNAITKNGWISGAKVVFKSTKKTGDYHGQMTSEIFTKWFNEKLLPNIPPHSLIIMDNAAYHNVLAEYSCPNSTCSKTRIVKWLEKNKIACNPDCLKIELLETLNKFASEPTYVIDELAKQGGHEVIRTPPYHPELQPIEICWGVLKNEIGRHCDFTMKNLEIQLDVAFGKVTDKTCSKIIKSVREKEDAFWAEDKLIEEKNELHTDCLGIFS